MLKLKHPLLAASISISLLAPQISSAKDFILPLGDSITNGVYNPGNHLAYRDDLYDLLKNAGKVYGTDFEFVGTCIPVAGTDDYTGELGGECVRTDVANKGDGVSYDGKKLRHEGRAGWHASDINASGRLSTWLEFYALTAHTPNIALVHLGTNDIFAQENDVNKSDSVVEDKTYKETLKDIEGVIAKLKVGNADMDIYVAKILPMGKVRKANGTPDGIAVDYTGPGGDAAKGLNDLMTPAWANAQGVTIVDHNTGFDFNDDLDETGKIHPTLAGEAKMANRWFNAVYDVADPAKSTLTVSKTTVTANNEDSATVTVQAKNSSGDDITTGDDTVDFIGTDVSFTRTIYNGNGSYTTTVTRPTGIAGKVTIKAKLNGVEITDTKSITFLAGQKISFIPPTSKKMSDPKFKVNATSQKFNSIDPTRLPNKVSIKVKASSDSVCAISASNEVTLKKVGDCTLVATHDGGTVGGITYGAATPVTKTIVIKKGIQTITFTNTPTTAYIGQSISVSATSTSGVGDGIEPVIITSATPKICTDPDANGKVSIKAKGTCKLNANQAGNDNYEAAPLVTHEIVVSEDAIIIPAITDKTFGDAPFTVTATTASGAAVTLSSETTSVCTVSGTTVTLKDAGECTLKASSGSSTQTISFKVNKNASQKALDLVVKVINGSASITVEQLEPIKGLKNLKKGRDYTKAIKAGTYADKNHPTVAELQKVIDKANSDANKSGGSSSPLWLLTLSFIALFRRKKYS